MVVASMFELWKPQKMRTLDFKKRLMDKYPEIEVIRKTGKEKLHVSGDPLPHDLLSFWQWSPSDLVCNAMRGILAEYIVASAVGMVSGNRTEWDTYDIETNEGIKVEVKSGAYIQSWSQKKLSKILFGIRPTQGWDSANNSHSKIVERQSDVYVFCVLRHQVQETIDPLNMDQWDFYVLATKELNREANAQKTISLSRLETLKPLKATYAELYAAIKQATQ